MTGEFRIGDAVVYKGKTYRFPGRVCGITEDGQIVVQAAGDGAGNYRGMKHIYGPNQLEALEPGPVARPASGLGVKELRDAASALLEGMQSTYRARNNRQVSIEADDGEKCWIVHSDLTHALEIALAASTPEPSAKGAAPRAVTTDWTRCPICGEPDMRREADAEGASLIFCVNQMCTSNIVGNAGAAEAVERPERIWLDKDGLWTSSEWLGGADHKDGFGPFPEYVRADLITALQAERDRLRAEIAAKEAALRRLIFDYVNLLELGRDRIIAQGGTCDPVDVMEAGSPALRAARGALNGAGNDK